MGSRTPSPRRVLGVLAFVLVVLCLAPPRFTAWAGWFRDPMMVVVTPASRPMARLSSWIRPGDAPVERDTEIGLEEALRQKEDLETRYFDAIAQIEALRATVRELQGGRELADDRAYETFVAPRTGGDPEEGVIDVRGGSRNAACGSCRLPTAIPKCSGISTGIFAKATSRTPRKWTCRLPDCSAI